MGGDDVTEEEEGGGGGEEEAAEAAVLCVELGVGGVEVDAAWPLGALVDPCGRREAVSSGFLCGEEGGASLGSASIRVSTFFFISFSPPRYGRRCFLQKCRGPARPADPSPAGREDATPSWEEEEEAPFPFFASSLPPRRWDDLFRVSAECREEDEKKRYSVASSFSSAPSSNKASTVCVRLPVEDEEEEEEDGNGVRSKVDSVCRSRVGRVVMVA